MSTYRLDFRVPVRKGGVTDPEPYRYSATYLDEQMYLGVGAKASLELFPERPGKKASILGAAAAENVPFARSCNAGIYVRW
ncbi:hypothetical protein GCM10023187_46200 [Nibrella viscosa]|uniref:Uncharacterized protein n=1 Tax=Nibrella viscosa TaxID=1084524 RepID=A0ABP8KU97_9BACT